MYVQNYKNVYIKHQLKAYILTKYEAWKCDNYKVTTRLYPPTVAYERAMITPNMIARELVYVLWSTSVLFIDSVHVMLQQDEYLTPSSESRLENEQQRIQNDERSTLCCSVSML